MATKRMEGEARLRSILDAGARLAGKFGAKNVTRKMVAEAAKASPALVAHYTGSAAEAQKAYAKHAKKLGIEQPAKEKIEAIGLKMRAHGPRQAPVKRARAAKEVKAIKRNVAKVAKVVKAAKPAPRNKAKPVSPEQAIATLPKPVKPVNVPPPAKKKPVTAARAPLPAPVTPPTPADVVN